MARFAAVLLAGAALGGCKGGEGESCKSSGPLGALYCDDGLICNGADGNVCEAPMSKHENGSCDSTQLCVTGLYCNLLQHRCAPTLKEGDPCSDPSSCGPDLLCGHDPATRSNVCHAASSDGGVTGATVVGTLTLPDSAQAKGMVSLYATLPPGGTPVTSSAIMSNGTTSLDYELIGVPSGTYFILGFIDVDASGGTSSTPGDYTGWYGHNGDGNPPAAANAVVPDGGTVRFDFSLVLR